MEFLHLMKTSIMILNMVQRLLARATFTTNGGGLVIKNEDGWGAVLSSQNIRWCEATSATLEIGGNQVFHTGNDGPGSGLDADTVDGIQGASLLRSDAKTLWTQF